MEGISSGGDSQAFTFAVHSFRLPEITCFHPPEYRRSELSKILIWIKVVCCNRVENTYMAEPSIFQDLAKIIELADKIPLVPDGIVSRTLFKSLSPASCYSVLPKARN